MRKLIYKLIDGTTVDTLKDAKSSGLSYTIGFIDEAGAGAPLSAKRLELMKKYGFVPIVKKAY
jgi:hypothetical protein